jgi:hypothetical protein
MDSTSSREAEIAKIAQSGEAVAALQQHLKEVTEGAAFKGSHRSGLFLRHVIDQAIGGHFESLKERAIGMELFGRSPSYVTGEDAIVRVTANDVRKRLVQHYNKYGAGSEFRINLPLGSYVPEITRERHIKTSSLDAGAENHDPGNALGGFSEDSDSASASVTEQKPAAAVLAAIDLKTPHSAERSRRQSSAFAILSAVLTVALLGTLWLWKHSSRTGSATISVLPWSAFFSAPNPTHLVTSDPDIVGVQIISGRQLSISDYANRNYLPGDSTLTPELRKICLLILRGDKAASADTQIAVEISALAQTYSRNINVQTARSLQFLNLKTDDNFIFLGSPRSDPWFTLFNNELDFQFSIDASGLESIHNVHPRPNELPSYVPTAGGGFTGQSYGIVAFVQNADQNGHVLLVAGANAEATEVAGKFVTNLPRLSLELQKCGISSSSPLKHFELLLRVNMMAGSPSEFDVLACHILPGTSAAH